MTDPKALADLLERAVKKAELSGDFRKAAFGAAAYDYVPDIIAALRAPSAEAMRDRAATVCEHSTFLPYRDVDLLRIAIAASIRALPIDEEKPDD